MTNCLATEKVWCTSLYFSLHIYLLDVTEYYFYLHFPVIIYRICWRYKSPLHWRWSKLPVSPTWPSI